MATFFILIETSTQACSVAIAQNGVILSELYTEDNKAHSRELLPYLKKAMADNGLNIKDCSAICVSSGPGSYTGLRVGISTAKGLCFGANIPLIGIGTLNGLAQMAIETVDTNLLDQNTIIIPMIDARRMEVYSAYFNTKGEQLSEPKAVILEEYNYSDLIEKYDHIVLIGDGAAKSESTFTEEQLSKITIIDSKPQAKHLLALASTKFANQQFEDIAYFEPFYLKEFIAGVSKKSILGN